jgi:hypothetical protein
VQAAGERRPRLSASIAAPDSEPKLIAEMLTTDAGRNAAAAAGRTEHLGAGQLDVVPGGGDDGGTARRTCGA